MALWTPEMDAFVRLHVEGRGDQSVADAVRWAARMLKVGESSALKRWYLYLKPGAKRTPRLQTVRVAKCRYGTWLS